MSDFVSSYIFNKQIKKANDASGNSKSKSRKKKKPYQTKLT